MFMQIFCCQANIKSDNNINVDECIFRSNVTKGEEELNRALDLIENNYRITVFADLRKLFAPEFKSDSRDIYLKYNY